MIRKEKAGFQAQQTTTNYGDSEVKSNQEPAALAQAAKDEPASIDKENEEEEAAKGDQQ